MKLNIFFGDKSFTVEVSPSQSVKDLQDLISSETSIPSSEQRLTLRTAHDKTFLSPLCPLSSFELLPTSVVFLKHLPSRRPIVPHRRTYSELFPWISRLVLACESGSLDCFYECLEDYERYKQASLEVADLERLLNTPLNGKWCCVHYAVFNNRSEMLKELLALAADVNTVTSDYWTPLQIACYQGHLDCVNVLLSHPAVQVNQMTSARGTGLHLAAQNGHIEIVRLLLQHGVDVGLEDPEGKTAVEYAANIRIAEEIPKFVGEQILQQYNKENIQQPLGFSGEVWHTSGSAATEKMVFLVLDPKNGNFNHYSKRNDYLNEYPPKYSIPFETISGVKVAAEVYDEKYFFLITAPEIRLKYYTGFKDMTEEWTNRVLGFIEYFRQPGNRKKTDFEPFPPEVPEQTTHLHCFEILSEIGFGSYGKVFKVKKKGTDEVYALKALSQAYLRQKKQVKYAIAECKILKLIQHPFILQLHWAFQSDSHLFMVLDFCPLGDFSVLLTYVHHLTVKQARFYISEIVLAIEYLHSLCIIYRDLKPHNVLLDEHGHVRLADFGLAKLNATQESPAMSFCGSPAYLAPEMILRSGVWNALDVYAIGVNLYEMLTGKPPFFCEDMNEMYERIVKGGVTFPEQFDEDAKDLIQLMMRLEAGERPSIQEVKAHKFFEGVNWDAVYRKTDSPPFSLNFLKGVQKNR
jgi:hypothetical protein